MLTTDQQAPDQLELPQGDSLNEIDVIQFEVAQTLEAVHREAEERQRLLDRITERNRQIFSHYVEPEGLEKNPRQWIKTFDGYANTAGYRIESVEEHEEEKGDRSQLFDQDNVDPSQQISPNQTLEALSENLTLTRREYARYTALARAKATKANQDKLNQARLNYEKAREEAGKLAATLMATDVQSFNDLRALSTIGATEELKLLEAEIVNQRLQISDSKKLSKFYDWWARRGGAKNFLQGVIPKAAVVGGIGLVSGLAFGAAGSVIGGPAVGLVAGAAVARSVSRGLAAAKINKEADAPRVAQAQSQKQFMESQQMLESLAQTKANDGETLMSRDLTELIDHHTEKEIRRNQSRWIGAVALGVGMGLVGAGIGIYVHDHLISTKHATGSKNTSPAPKANPTTPVKPTAPPATTPSKPSVPTTPVKPPIANAPPPAVVPPSPQVNLDQWSWDVAHQMYPGHETEYINQALNQYSQQTGLASHLVPFNGTTMIQVGNHIANPAEMQQINSIMASLS